MLANKIDLNPDRDIVNDLRKELRQDIHPISAVTGSGVKELTELLWQKVKEAKE